MIAERWEVPSLAEKNILFYGDNLDILRGRTQSGHAYISDESVDLIYLDPPFKSNQDYNVLFDEKDGTKAAAQIQAFEDTWEWSDEAMRAYDEVVEAGGKVSDAMRAFMTFLGPSDMMAYLCMMAPRLKELHRVLKATGSIYLHCDATASHYLKMLLDSVFGPGNFRREVIWRSGWVSGFKTAAKNWIRNHDVLLYAVKDRRENFTFNKDLAYKPHPPGYERRGGGENPKGVAIDDVWDEVEMYSPWIKSFSTEKLGYSTQKPVALLDRIISISSNPGDVVLDPFCGCGTTIESAHGLKRRWIGIDITHLAINLIKYRLDCAYGTRAATTYKVIGEPTTISGAKELAAKDPFQFQWWALSLVSARPSQQKKTGDRGVDGRRFIQDEGKDSRHKQIIFSVKGGKLHATYVRDLIGTVKNQGAEFGVMVSMDEPTKKMREEAASAPRYKSPSQKTTHPSIQLITIEELLNGKTLDLPVSANVTLAQAKKRKPTDDTSQQSLFIAADRAATADEEDEESPF